MANLIESIDWPSDCLKKIKKLNKTVTEFRKYIEPARHTLLAHYDKHTVISGTTRGAFPKGEDKKLLDTLEQMCNVMHNAACGKIFGSIVPEHSVLDFKDTLAKAIAFDKIFENSKGKDLHDLFKLVEDIRSGQL